MIKRMTGTKTYIAMITVFAGAFPIIRLTQISQISESRKSIQSLKSAENLRICKPRASQTLII